MTLLCSDVTSTAMEIVHNNRMYELLIFSLAVALNKIRDSVGSETIGGVENILHREQLRMTLFK